MTPDDPATAVVIGLLALIVAALVFVTLVWLNRGAPIG